jgi:uncharacterized protein
MAKNQQAIATRLSMRLNLMAVLFCLILFQRRCASARRQLATNGSAGYPVAMSKNPQTLSADELRGRLSSFCEKHHIQRLEVFGSAARGQTGPGSDVDLLVTFDESAPVSTADLLDMAGEAEELIGRPVDFVLRPSLEKSPNRLLASTFWPPPCACMETDQLGGLDAAWLIASYVKDTTETDFRSNTEKQDAVIRRMEIYFMSRFEHHLKLNLDPKTCDDAGSNILPGIG